MTLSGESQFIILNPDKPDKSLAKTLRRKEFVDVCCTNQFVALRLRDEILAILMKYCAGNCNNIGSKELIYYSEFSFNINSNFKTK